MTSSRASRTLERAFEGSTAPPGGVPPPRSEEESMAQPDPDQQPPRDVAALVALLRYHPER
ncbi:MAG: hypothetical protein ACXV3S_12505, partial [Kineosporiaceae bacterium]